MKSREVTLHVVRRPDRPARFYALLIRASEVTWERAGAAVPSAGFYALLIRASEVTLDKFPAFRGAGAVSMPY